jgi:hypothetical protein
MQMESMSVAYGVQSLIWHAIFASQLSLVQERLSAHLCSFNTYLLVSSSIAMFYQAIYIHA